MPICPPASHPWPQAIEVGGEAVPLHDAATHLLRRVLKDYPSAGVATIAEVRAGLEGKKEEWEEEEACLHALRLAIDAMDREGEVWQGLVALVCARVDHPQVRLFIE